MAEPPTFLPREDLEPEDLLRKAYERRKRQPQQQQQPQQNSRPFTGVAGGGLISSNVGAPFQAGPTGRKFGEGVNQSGFVPNRKEVSPAAMQQAGAAAVASKKQEQQLRGQKGTGFYIAGQDDNALTKYAKPKPKPKPEPKPDPFLAQVGETELGFQTEDERRMEAAKEESKKRTDSVWNSNLLKDSRYKQTLKKVAEGKKGVEEAESNLKQSKKEEVKKKPTTKQASSRFSDSRKKAAALSRYKDIDFNKERASLLRRGRIS
jgi:hypothetical protein